jgi:hypothetical protein
MIIYILKVEVFLSCKSLLTSYDNPKDDNLKFTILIYLPRMKNSRVRRLKRLIEVEVDVNLTLEKIKKYGVLICSINSDNCVVFIYTISFVE